MPHAARRTPHAARAARCTAARPVPNHAPPPQITQFLNKFDMSTRYKLARINERLNSLERTIEFCEAAVRGALGEQGAATRARDASAAPAV